MGPFVASWGLSRIYESSPWLGLNGHRQGSHIRSSIESWPLCVWWEGGGKGSESQALFSQWPLQPEAPWCMGTVQNFVVPCLALGWQYSDRSQAIPLISRINKNKKPEWKSSDGTQGELGNLTVSASGFSSGLQSTAGLEGRHSYCPLCDFQLVLLSLLL